MQTMLDLCLLSEIGIGAAALGSHCRHCQTSVEKLHPSTRLLWQASPQPSVARDGFLAFARDKCGVTLAPFRPFAGHCTPRLGSTGTAGAGAASQLLPAASHQKLLAARPAAHAAVAVWLPHKSRSARWRRACRQRRTGRPVRSPPHGACPLPSARGQEQDTAPAEPRPALARCERVARRPGQHLVFGRGAGSIWQVPPQVIARCWSSSLLPRWQREMDCQG